MNIKEITLRGQSIAAAVLYENEAKGIAVYAAMRMDSREDDMASVPQFVIFMETDAEEGPKCVLYGNFALCKRKMTSELENRLLDLKASEVYALKDSFREAAKTLKASDFEVRDDSNPESMSVPQLLDKLADKDVEVKTVDGQDYYTLDSNAFKALAGEKSLSLKKVLKAQGLLLCNGDRYDYRETGSSSGKLYIVCNKGVTANG
uniref:hypothetical protein n=1 Tax=Gemmiger formicilis TaxID=745368 RepID=UPI0040389D96